MTAHCHQATEKRGLLVDFARLSLILVPCALAFTCVLRLRAWVKRNEAIRMNKLFQAVEKGRPKLTTWHTRHVLAYFATVVTGPNKPPHQTYLLEVNLNRTSRPSASKHEGGHDKARIGQQIGPLNSSRSRNNPRDIRKTKLLK